MGTRAKYWDKLADRELLKRIGGSVVNVVGEGHGLAGYAEPLTTYDALCGCGYGPAAAR
jgi:hypothetical protein